MYGREKLETYYKTSCVKDMDKFYGQDKADKVMDAMERRIARLTALVEGLKRNSVELGEMYKSRLAMEQARINELEEALDNAVTGGKIALEQAKILEKKLEDVQNTMATENVDLGMENHKLKERVKELEATISKMETTTPKWISLKDRLPYSMERVLVCTTRGTFAPATYSALTNSWIKHGQLFGKITHWMQLPPPPTNEST